MGSASVVWQKVSSVCRLPGCPVRSRFTALTSVVTPVRSSASQWPLWSLVPGVATADSPKTDQRRNSSSCDLISAKSQRECSYHGELSSGGWRTKSGQARSGVAARQSRRPLSRQKRPSHPDRPAVEGLTVSEGPPASCGGTNRTVRSLSLPPARRPPQDREPGVLADRRERRSPHRDGRSRPIARPGSRLSTDARHMCPDGCRGGRLSVFGGCRPARLSTGDMNRGMMSGEFRYERAHTPGQGGETDPRRPQAAHRSVL